MKLSLNIISLISLIFFNLVPINYVLSKERKFISSNNIKNINLNKNFKVQNIIQEKNFPKDNKNNSNEVNLFEFNKSDYILGPGDKLKILIYEPEVLNDTFEIMTNGMAKLPFIGEFYLNELTLKQAKEKIYEEVQKDLISPYFDIQIVTPRPLKINLMGHVDSPGIYTLPFKINLPNNAISGQNNQIQTFKYNPTIVDLLIISGGVKTNSNIDEIEIIRKFKSNNELINKSISISLLDLFIKGKNENNIFLKDGDIVKVKESQNNGESSLNIIRANLLPKSIPVFIIGEVQKPGKYDIPINSSLVDSILIAGGPVNSRANRSNVRIQRILNDGEVSRKMYKINYSNEISEEFNPVVRKNDIVFVESSSLAKFSDKLNILANPVTNILSIYTLLRIVND